jgi:uncharacterized protein YggT (Ycf19 family)
MSNQYDEQREQLELQAEQRRLQLEAQRLANAQWNAGLSRVIAALYSLVGALEILLAFRFGLRLFGANTENQFARFIYTLSDPFVAPFSTLFISPTSADATNIFDVNLLVAITSYGVLGLIVCSLIWRIWSR